MGFGVVSFGIGGATFAGLGFGTPFVNDALSVMGAVREAQRLDVANSITESRDLPGDAHWNPAGAYNPVVSVGARANRGGDPWGVFSRLPTVPLVSAVASKPKRKLEPVPGPAVVPVGPQSLPAAVILRDGSTTTTTYYPEGESDVPDDITWEEVAQQYPWINEEVPQEPDPYWLPGVGVRLGGPNDVEQSGMAIDWGDVAGAALSTISRGLVGNPTTGAVPASSPGSSTIQAAMASGTSGLRLASGRRRRRRRLLTPTDLGDLAALKTLVGNGDALKFAVMKAVRR